MACIVSVERLTYTYPGQDEAAPSLDSVSFELEAGEVILLLGRSGSGKSTLLRALTGLVPHFHGGTFKGRVRIAGFDTREARPRDLAGTVGLVFQDPESQAVMTTVEREIAFGLENIGIASDQIGRLVEESLIALGLSHLRRAPLATLSGGELQKVMLAATIAMQPQLLLLDEPTSQLDPVSAEELLSALRRLNEDTGTTIVLAEHRVDRCLHMAHRVLFFDQGSLVFDGRPTEFARWAIENQPAFVPPVTRLFAAHAMAPLPLTVREARSCLAASGLGPVWASPQDSQKALSSFEKRHLLQASSLTVGYPPDPVLLSDVDLELRSGECVALMGENGCGKSTLVSHFNGLRKPLAGRVVIDGLQVAELSVAQAARLCGVLGQNPGDYFVRDTLDEELDYSLTLHISDQSERYRRRNAVIEDLDLATLLQRNPRDLSGGERTRAALALMVAPAPPFLVLDEPTRGLDPVAKEELASRLQRWAEDGMGIVVISHDVEFACQCCRRAILLGNGGVMIDGPIDQVLDGSLFFSTQVNRLLHHYLPGVLRAEQVALERKEAEHVA